MGLLGFEVLMEVVLKGYNTVQSVQYQSMFRQSVLLTSCWYLAGLFFDPEDGGDIFLRNVDSLSIDYTVLRSRK
jgi:hypothetical protein